MNYYVGIFSNSEKKINYKFKFMLYPDPISVTKFAWAIYCNSNNKHANAQIFPVVHPQWHGYFLHVLHTFQCPRNIFWGREWEITLTFTPELSVLFFITQFSG